MNIDTFNDLLESTIKRIRSVLGSKSAEYSSGENKLYNFYRAAEILRCSVERALWGMFIKHFVSVQDIVEAVDCLQKSVDCEELTPDQFNKAAKARGFTKELVDEKTTDMINYILLLKGQLYDRYGWDVDDN